MEETGGTLYHMMLYTSPWSRFELTTTVVIGTSCLGRCKSNYHTMKATTVPLKKKEKRTNQRKKNNTLKKTNKNTHHFSTGSVLFYAIKWKTKNTVSNSKFLFTFTQRQNRHHYSNAWPLTFMALYRHSIKRKWLG